MNAPSFADTEEIAAPAFDETEEVKPPSFDAAAPIDTPKPTTSVPAEDPEVTRIRALRKEWDAKKATMSPEEYQAKRPFELSLPDASFKSDAPTTFDVRPDDNFNQSGFTLPRATAEGVGSPTAAGVINGIERTVEGAVTPSNVLLAGALSGAPALAQKAAGAYFGATMAKGTAEKVSEGIAAKTPEDRAQAFTEAGLSGAMALGAVKHAAGGRIAPPKADVTPIADAGLPSTAEAVASNPVVAEALKKVDPAEYSPSTPSVAPAPAFDQTDPVANEPIPAAPAPQEPPSEAAPVTPEPEATPTPTAPISEPPPVAPEISTPEPSVPPQEAPPEPVLPTEKPVAQSDTSGVTAPVDSGSPTSIRNAVVDQERAKRGLPPAMEPARRTFGTVWDDTMRRIDTDPAWQDGLIDSLRDNPRALTDSEDAALLHRQITLQAEYDSAARATNEAYDAGDEAMTAESRLRSAQALDKLQDIYDIGKKVGTETGRGLNARKMAAAEDYSLASMMTRKRASQGGEPLTPAQADEVQAQHDKIQTTAAALAEHEAAAVDTSAQAAVDETVKELKQEVNKEKRTRKARVPDESVVSAIDQKAAAARSKLGMQAPEPVRPASVQKKARGTSASEHFESNPIVSLLMEHGGILSKSGARTLWSAAKWERNKGEFEDALPLSNPTHNKIYRPNGMTPDEATQALIDAGLLPHDAKPADMWEAVSKASQSAARIRGEAAGQARQIAEYNKQHADFEKDTSKHTPGTSELTTWDLGVGDHVKIGTETMKVIAEDAESLTLEDGKKYGRQTIEPGQIIFGERLEPKSEAPAPIEPEPEAAKTGAPKADLFAGRADEPFNLFAESNAERAAREHSERQDALKKQKAAEEAAKAEAEKQQAKLFDEPAPAPTVAKKVTSFLDKQAEAARKRIEKRRGDLLTNPAAPFVQLAEHTIIGASHLAHGIVDFAEWSKRMTQEFGDTIKSSLAEIFEKSKAYVASQGALTKTAEKLREGAAEGSGIKELQPMIRRLAKEFVRSGIHDREPLLDAVHDIVKEALPGTTRRQTMDAISGYGDFKPLSKDEIDVQLRDIKGQMQQVAKIEDMLAKQAPAKTGVERRTPSAEERALLKEVNEMKKKGGFNITDPEQQLKTALGAVKTRLKNQIEDLGRAIAKREPIVDNKSPVPMDAEADALKAQRDALKAQYDEIFKKPGLTDEQRLEAAKKAVQRSIDDLEERVKNKMFSKPGKPAFSHPDLEPLRARQKALREELQAMKDAANPKKTPLEVALATMKTRLRNRTLELQDKLRNKDFAAKPRRSVPLDAEATRLKAENEKAKLDYQRGLKADQLAKRSSAEKFLDGVAKWRRAFVLSGPVTLAKLTAAATETILIHPIEEAVGGAIGKIVPGVAKRAPRHGGVNVGAEAKAISQTLTHLFSDAWTTLKTGHSELDHAYGRADLMPREWKDFVGAIHGALKSPAKRNEFTRSYTKRIEHAARNGVDVTDPLVQTRIANEAYQDANRSIFLEKNIFVDAYRRALSRFDQVDKVTGKPSLVGKTVGAAARFTLPVVTVPVNIAARTFEYTLGTVIGSARVAAAAAKGFDKLTPDQADSIMRNLKRGSLGAALVAYGYYNPQQFGGYYTGGRGEKDVKPGGARIDGVDIPRALLHNPLLEQLQIGATMRRVADSKLRNGDKATQGIGAGAVAAGLGIAEHAPFIDQVVRQAKLFNPHERKQYMDELAKSVTPALFQWIAEKIDSDSVTGGPVKRKPETVGQAVEMGIPGMRQNVPKKK